MSIEKLLSLYRLTPETGLYSTNLDRVNQAKTFLKYILFLKQRLYEGPRSTELRRITKIMRSTCVEKPAETKMVFDALRVNYDDQGVQFNELMDSYAIESDVKKAGALYKEYTKLLSLSEKDSCESKKLEEIRSGLTKKYPVEEVEKRLQTVIDSARTQRELAKQKSIEVYELLKKDSVYLTWKKLVDTWDSVGFLELAEAYHKLDTDTGAIRSANGISLEQECIEKLTTYFAKLHDVSPKDIAIVRNTIIRGTKTKEMVGEIDVVVVNTVTDSVVGLVEVKSGIYDIPQAVEQLDKITSSLRNDPTILKKIVDEKVKTLVVTTIPPHNPVTGASYSDVQLISSVLFSKTDTRLKRIVSAITDLSSDFDLSDETVDTLCEILSELRKKMVSHIDPLTAIERLGQNLIVI